MLFSGGGGGGNKYRFWAEIYVDPCIFSKIALNYLIKKVFFSRVLAIVGSRDKSGAGAGYGALN